MDTDQILDQNAPAGLEVGPAAMNHLRLSAKWAKFLAILGFIFIGFMVLVGFMIMSFGTFAEEFGMASGLGMLYFLFALVYFFPVLYLYRFADRTQEALQSRHSGILTEGLENLGKHYQFIGILTAIVLGLYVLILVFAVGVGSLLG